MQKRKVLIAEDDAMVATVIEKTLLLNDYEVKVCSDGREALTTMQFFKPDLVLTDWMMPRMDGIELMRQIRQTYKPSPIIVMLTAIGTPQARQHALSCGADGFLSKPCKARELIDCLADLFTRNEQAVPTLEDIQLPPRSASVPPYVCVGIVTSTGGPTVLNNLVKTLPALPDAALVIVVHAPSWVITELQHTMQRRTSMRVIMAEQDTELQPGTIYLAPCTAEVVLQNSPPSFDLRMAVAEEEESFVPSADPLFKSIAEIFGRNCIGVVLTGMGKDGAHGSRFITAAGGEVYVQDPASTPASGMPATVLETNPAAISLPVAELPEAIANRIDMLVNR